MDGRVKCAVIAMDWSSMFYNACSICEKTLPESSTASCSYCFKYRTASTLPPFKRFFRVVVSIATDTKVHNVICFDRVARVMMGCSADEYCQFASLHPAVGATVAKILEGEMFEMVLSKPKNVNAQHMRVSFIKPLRSDFKPAMKVVGELCTNRTCPS